jgi:hypothetical protein
MSDEEKNIRELELQFPLLSGTAFMAARQQTLASGQSVLQSEQGALYEVFPDGTRRRLKEIEPATPIAPGSRITLR